MKYILVATALFYFGCTTLNTLFNVKIENKNLSLTSFGNSTQEAPKNATLILSDGTFTGFGGCNNFNGEFDINKYYIHFTINNVGTKVCSQTYKEGEYFKKLVNTTHLVIMGNKLLFKDKYEQTLLTFTKSEL